MQFPFAQSFPSPSGGLGPRVVLLSYSEHPDSQAAPELIVTQRSVDGGKTFTPLATAVPISSMSQLADGSLVSMDYRTTVVGPRLSWGPRCFRPRSGARMTMGPRGFSRTAQSRPLTPTTTCTSTAELSRLATGPCWQWSMATTPVTPSTVRCSHAATMAEPRGRSCRPSRRALLAQVSKVGKSRQ